VQAYDGGQGAYPSKGSRGRASLGQGINTPEAENVLTIVQNFRLYILRFLRIFLSCSQRGMIRERLFASNWNGLYWPLHVTGWGRG